MLKKIFTDKLTYFIIAFFAVWYLFPFMPLRSIMAPLKGHNTLITITMMSLLIVSTAISMFVQFGIVFEISKYKFNWKSALITLLISIGLIIICIIWAEHYLLITNPKIFPKNMTYLNRLIGVASNIGVINIPQKGFISLITIFLCTGLGTLISFLIREKNMLVPVMLCCAFIDVWTVTVGFVSKTLQKTPHIVSAVSTEVPMIGSKGFRPLSTIGPGDFIFVALVFACVFRYKMNVKLNFWLMFSILTLGMLLIVFGVLPALPALICVAIAALLANRKEFTLSKQEKLYIGIVFSFLLILMLVFKFLLNK